MYISVGKVGRGPGGKAYYLRGLHREGGTSTREDPDGWAGHWFGRLAAELGLVGPVESEAFSTVHDGFSPAGEPLSRNPRHPGRRPAYDLTHALVKDASIIASVGPDWGRRIRDQVATPAVDASLRYLEAEACWTRRGRNGAERVRGDGFVGAAFFHHASRPSAGGTENPHLHRHCVVFNTTRGPDGQWTALDGGPLYRLARSAAALASVEEAYLLEQVGFRLRRSGRTFRIEGLADSLRDACSRRSREIRAEAGEGATPAARDRANRATRGRKRAPDLERLEVHWRARNERHGLTPERAAWLARPAPERAAAAGELANITRKVLHLQQGTFTLCDLVEWVALACQCRGVRACEVRLQVWAEVEQGRRETQPISPPSRSGSGGVVRATAARGGPHGPDRRAATAPPTEDHAMAPGVARGLGSARAAARGEVARIGDRSIGAAPGGPEFARGRGGRLGEGRAAVVPDAADPRIWVAVEKLLRGGRAVVDWEVADAERRLVHLWARDPAAPESRIILASSGEEARAINALCQRWTQARRPGAGAGVATRGGEIFPGDRIICLRDNPRYDVRSGEVGILLEVDAKRDSVRIKLDHAGRIVTLPLAAYGHNNLALGFAVTSFEAGRPPVASTYLFIHGRITAAQSRCLVGGTARVLATTWGDIQGGLSRHALDGRPPQNSAPARVVQRPSDRNAAAALSWGRERQR